MTNKLLNNAKFKFNFELHKQSLIDELNLMRDFEMGNIGEDIFFDGLSRIQGDR